MSGIVTPTKPRWCVQAQWSESHRRNYTAADPPGWRDVPESYATRVERWESRAGAIDRARQLSAEFARRRQPAIVEVWVDDIGVGSNKIERTTVLLVIEDGVERGTAGR